MEALQRASQVLLTKYMLLVLCVHLCAALDYYSFYAGLAVKDIAATLPLSSMCECHSACKAIINCTAATHVAKSGKEPECLISKTSEIVKGDLAPGDADVHTTIIKGYQVKFLDIGGRNFLDAKEECKKMQMSLATPSDAASHTLLAKIHKEKYPYGRGNWDYWVDITKTGDNEWTWGDRIEVTAEVGANPWAPEYPKWGGTCGMVSVQFNFSLVDSDCGHKRGFICTS